MVAHKNLEHNALPVHGDIAPPGRIFLNGLFLLADPVDEIDSGHINSLPSVHVAQQNDEQNYDDDTHDDYDDDYPSVQGTFL